MPKRVEALLGRVLAVFARARAWRCISCQQVFGPFDSSGIYQVPDGRCCFCAQWERVVSPPVTAGVPGGEGAEPRMGDAPTVITSPYSLGFADDTGLIISIAVTFNEATRAITGCTVHRDDGCRWTRIYVGVGADGTVESTARVFTVPVGTTTLTTQQLASRGATVIEDITGLQITAGP